jgi:hypothetical protein
VGAWRSSPAHGQKCPESPEVAEAATEQLALLLHRHFRGFRGFFFARFPRAGARGYTSLAPPGQTRSGLCAWRATSHASHTIGVRLNRSMLAFCVLT